MTTATLPPLDPIDVSGLSGRELHAVWDGLQAVEQAALSVFNQPRCHASDDTNAAGEALEQVLDWASKSLAAVAYIARTQPARERGEAENLRWIAVKQAVQNGNLGEVFVEAATRPILAQELEQ